MALGMFFRARTMREHAEITYQIIDPTLEGYLELPNIAKPSCASHANYLNACENVLCHAGLNVSVQHESCT